MHKYIHVYIYCNYLNNSFCSSSAEQLTVGLGIDYKFTPNNNAHEVRVRVDEFIMHENYYVNNDSSPFYDLALLRLAESVNYTDFIRPACLPEPFQELPLSSLCYISGWGNTRGTGRGIDIDKHL